MSATRQLAAATALVICALAALSGGGIGSVWAYGTVAFLPLLWAGLCVLRPLARLAQAARQGHPGAPAAALPECGPRELREIAARLRTALDERVQDAARLDESEARYRVLFEHAPDAITVLDVDRNRFEAVNPVAVALFGLPREALLASNPADLSPERQPDGTASADGVRARLDRVLAGDTLTFDWMHRDAAGNPIACEVRLVRLPVPGRRLVRGSITDVRERRRAREELLFYQAAIRSAANPIGFADDTGTVTYVNPAFGRLWGCEPAQAVGRPAQSFLSRPEHARRVIVALRRAGSWSGEMQARRVDGSTVPLEVTASLVPGSEGRPFRMMGVFVDVSARKAAEAALRASEQLFRTTISVLAEGVVVQDTRDRIVVTNAAAEHILGLTADQLMGLSSRSPNWRAVHADGSVFRTEDHPSMRALATGQPVSGVVMGVHKPDGSLTWIEINSRPILGADRRTEATVTSFADVTLRKAAEAAIRGANASLERRVAERTAELEAFTYSVSHDLRAPLRAIDGYSSLVLADDGERLSAESRALLERSRAAAGRMGQMIDDLLGLSRIGRAEVNRQRVDLSALAREIAADLQDKEPRRGVDWAIAPHAVANADPGLARSVLENLLSNAWRYTSRREHARIEFGESVDGAGARSWFVRDNGAGFDPVYAHKLFGAFQRLHTDREFPGHGIGLAIVRRIVERHGGHVTAHGTPDEGATFAFSLGPGA